MSLFYRIMMQVPEKTMSKSDDYCEGFAVGTYRAAKKAKESDDLMAEMADELEHYCDDKNTAEIWEKYKSWENLSYKGDLRERME